MCGIYAAINSKIDVSVLESFFKKIQHRGPDMSSSYNISDYSVTDSPQNITHTILGFHRLAICDKTTNGMQPFNVDGNYLICNGEIYNHHEIETKYNLQKNLLSGSDCECIIHVFNQGKIYVLVAELDAEFAFVIFDHYTRRVFAARDRFGVRPLFYGLDNDNSIYFASELKAISHCQTITPFLPGHLMAVELDNFNIKMHAFYTFPTIQINNNYNDILACIRGYFIKAVQKRLMSERNIGCLLSGGLDSSLVASVLVKLAKGVCNFYSIGLKDSVDLIAARQVASYLNIPPENHHIVEFTTQQGIEVIPEVISQLETYDITTIRASVPQYLLARYIHQLNRDDNGSIVILSGEGSDELNAGYSYFKMAPSAHDLQLETQNLIQNLYMFDNLRTDRTTAKWGLEVRVPFLDNDLVDFVMQINPELKLSHKFIEKKLFRDAFHNWLPTEILYRPKEAFSDAVSSKQESWYHSIQSHVNSLISESDLINSHYDYNPPQTREALYYRQIFNTFYPNHDKIISHYWLPKWQHCDIQDPSATVLKCYTGSL